MILRNPAFSIGAWIALDIFRQTMFR